MAVREILAHFGVKFDTHELTKGHDQVNGMVQSMTHFGHALAGAFVFHGIENFVEKTIAAASGIKRASRMLGIQTDQMQQYDHAANMSGVETESLTTGLRFLQRSAYAAANGGKAMAAIFTHLGVEVKDSNGKLKPTTSLLDEMSDKIKGIEDPAEQTALAMKIFGRGGAAMLPMLKKGSEGLKEYRDQVDELGGGFSQEFFKLSTKFQQHEKQLGMLKRSISAQLVGLAIPGLMTFGHYVEKAGHWLLKANQNGEMLRAAIAAFTAVALSRLPQVLAALMHLNTAANLAALKWAALFVVFDELRTWLSGGESFIGDFFGLLDEEINKSAAIFGDSVLAMAGSWDVFGAGIVAGAKTFGFGIIIAFNEVANSFAMIFAGIADLWDKTLQGMHLPGWMQDMLGGDAGNKDGATNRRKAQGEAEQSRVELGGWMAKSLDGDSNVKRLQAAIKARKDSQAQIQETAAANSAAEDGKIYKNNAGTFVLGEQTVSAPVGGGGNGGSKTEVHDQSQHTVNVTVPGTTPRDIATKTAHAVARVDRSYSNALLFSGEPVVEE
jgi:hypothetical protein